MPQRDKFAQISYKDEFGGCPLIEGAIAVFECAAHKSIDGGDHVILLGRVQRAAYRDGLPLIFNAGQYCTSSPLAEI